MNNDTPADAITVTQADKDLLEALQAVTTNGYVGGYIMEVEGLEIIARHRTTALAAQDGLVEALRIARVYVQNVVDAESKAFNAKDLAQIDAALASIEVKS